MYNINPDNINTEHISKIVDMNNITARLSSNDHSEVRGCQIAPSHSPLPLSSSSLSLELLFCGSAGEMQQNGSNFSKKENGASQPTLDGLSPSHPKWPSSTLCYQSAVLFQQN